jgi:hypothetical protein
MEKLLQARPRRATDIFYEDDGRVYAMIGGLQYLMSPPANLIWQAMGERSVSELIAAALEQLEGVSEEAVRAAVASFLLAADAAGLVVLFPAAGSEAEGGKRK